MGDAAHVLFPVQHRLIQVGDAPALGNVHPEQGGKLARRLLRHGVLPGAEGGEQVPVFIKGQVAVHHRGHRRAADFLPVLDAADRLIEAHPDLFHWIGPDAILQIALPGIIPGGHDPVVLINRHRLDAGGAQFDSQCQLAHAAASVCFFLIIKDEDWVVKLFSLYFIQKSSMWRGTRFPSTISPSSQKNSPALGRTKT